MTRNSTFFKLQRVITIICLCFFITSCAKKIVFQPSSIVPAATGKVKIKKDNNNNYSINLQVDNLADAKRLSPPQNTYIVWVLTRDNGVKNIGQINSSTGFLSGKIRASLNAVTPFKPKKIFITAENSSDILYPGNQEILTTRNF